MSELEAFIAELEAENDYKEEMRLKAKRYKQPKDPNAWLNRIEAIYRNELPKLPPELFDEFNRLSASQLKLARHCLKTEDSDELAVTIMLLYENLKIVRDNIQLSRAFHYSASQREKGREGAKARWGNRTELDLAITALANKQDHWGPLPTAELWPLLYAMLDDKGLNPNDTSREKPKNKDKITWDGYPKGITYKTFTNQISARRQKKSKK
ncbi:hypothetical protein [Microbulbifer sp. M83]|uniref:hypothetical protein n=1 Tax=Microbulbifer sp. M83 TaxID=3118246 RepID=UPI002FE2DF21